MSNPFRIVGYGLTELLEFSEETRPVEHLLQRLHALFGVAPGAGFDGRNHGLDQQQGGGGRIPGRRHRDMHAKAVVGHLVDRRTPLIGE